MQSDSKTKQMNIIGERNHNTEQTLAPRTPVYSGKDEDVYQTALREARTRLEAHGRLQPTAFIATSGGLADFPLAFETQEEKLSAYNEVSEAAGRANARSVTFVIEAWVSSSNFYGWPSEDPNRQEALCVTVVNPQGQVTKSTILRYTRVNGKIAWDTEEGEVPGQAAKQNLLKPWANNRNDLSGTLAGQLLPPTRSTHAEGLVGEEETSMPTITQKKVWEEFVECPVTFQRVKQLLSLGNNVVVVLGAGISACNPYRDTTDPKQAAWTLQEELVRQTGVPLPIGSDERPCFAFLAWTSTDKIDAPSEISVVSLATPADEGLCALAEASGIGEVTKKITLDAM